MKQHSLKAFCQALKKYDHFLLTCHVAPEGDAIGSILAMESLLRRLGKKTTVVCEDEFPKRLSFLYTKRWHELAKLNRTSSSFKAVVVADCPNLDRLGKVKYLIDPTAVIFNLDHHVSNEYFGHYNYVKPNSASSTAVAMEIFDHMKMPLTKYEATYLYVGLSTDTGSFRYGNTTSESLHLAARLLETGINLQKINESLYATYSIHKIRLYSNLLGRIKTASRGKIAWAVMRRADLKKAGATDEDHEGFVDLINFIKEVKVAFFLSELPERGHLRVSFRSKGSYDVNKIASYFNGGGHKKASGCRIEYTLKQAEKMIVDRIKKEFRFE